MDGAKLAAFLEMHHMTKYILDTRNLGLKIEPNRIKNEPWDILYFSDSTYAGTLVTRRSVSRFILCVRGVPVPWQSKAQRSMTPSNSEAEWEGLLETIEEVMFIFELL